ncbi:AraC family transcriptional regulator [Vibrio sp. ZSDZ34]|jgi:hypothetical protein|uniref:AraC family transcriptional regulator n=1 Tax=Vibrio gelatinilyticus TaxID=2893468 RepID=A0A9X1WB77_9VIBR|nr:AraC family transcriptional regulator [Vibrio gelatinilyticus]MCJ2376220.1 AraC family transcriptional regulator [Vibrio gelatinilyticus]
MKYAIEYSSTQYPFLTVTPRKKTIRNTLYRVCEGRVLLKLGKKEFLFSKGDTLWIPFDCLVSLTILPNTQLSRVDLSIRLADKLPHQAGLVTLPPVSDAILGHLETTDNIQDQHQADLLQVMRHEVSNLHPKLIESSLDKAISTWSSQAASTLEPELQVVLRLREAKKKRQSGWSTEKVVDSLFSGNKELYSNLQQSIFGEQEN